MTTVKVLAGDIGSGSERYDYGYIGSLALASVEIATEESMKKVGGTIGGALVGGLLLGGIGAIGGALLGWQQERSGFYSNLHNRPTRIDSNGFKNIHANPSRYFQRAD